MITFVEIGRLMVINKTCENLMTSTTPTISEYLDPSMSIVYYPSGVQQGPFSSPLLASCTEQLHPTVLLLAFVRGRPNHCCALTLARWSFGEDGELHAAGRPVSPLFSLRRISRLCRHRSN